MIDAETPAVQPRAFGWTAYNNYTEIYDWLDELLETYPTILTGHVVGYTYQDRPIRAVKISYKEVQGHTLREMGHTIVYILDSNSGIRMFSAGKFF